MEYWFNLLVEVTKEYVGMSPPRRYPARTLVWDGLGFGGTLTTVDISIHFHPILVSCRWLCHAFAAANTRSTSFTLHISQVDNTSLGAESCAMLRSFFLPSWCCKRPGADKIIAISSTMFYPCSGVNFNPSTRMTNVSQSANKPKSKKCLKPPTG